MGIKRLNHAVLYVSDVRQSADFYHQVLGFKLKPSDSPDRAVFTQAADSDNDHDPDGLLFEVTWFIPPALLTEEDKNRQGIRPLDFAAEKRRFAGL
ncbi:TPA: VOC family protein [Serratia marcescens]